MASYSTQHKAFYRYTVPSEVSITSTATADNNPGPGRIVDNLFQKWGKALERYLEKLLSRYGVGPEAVAARIRDLRAPYRSRYGYYDRFSYFFAVPISYDYISIPNGRQIERQRLSTYCKKLLKYAK